MKFAGAAWTDCIVSAGLIVEIVDQTGKCRTPTHCQQQQYLNLHKTSLMKMTFFFSPMESLH